MGTNIVTNAMPPIEIEAILKAAQVASSQNDRFLLVAFLIVIMIGAGILARWLANQYERMFLQWREDMHAAHQANATLHEGRIKQEQAYSSELREIVRANSSAAADTARAMGLVSQSLSDLQRSCMYMRASGGNNQPATIRRAEEG